MITIDQVLLMQHLAVVCLISTICAYIAAHPIEIEPKENDLDSDEED